MALTLASKKLSRIKKWQCPHCTQDSTRKENVVVHIKRIHPEGGEPVEKGNTGQEGNPFHIDLEGKSGGSRGPTCYHRNDIPTNGSRKGNKGRADIIDDVYRFVIVMEEKQGKVEKIKEFFRKYAATPPQTFDIQYVNSFIKALEESIYHDQNQPSSLPTLSPPTTQGYDNRNKIAGQKPDVQSTQNRQDLNGDAKRPLMRTGLADRQEGNCDRNDLPKNRWVVKRNPMGDYYDFYRIVDDPLQDAIDNYELNKKEGGY
jgi:hypothetical protein